MALSIEDFDLEDYFYLANKGEKQLELETMYLSLPLAGNRLRDFAVNNGINPNCTDIYKNNALMSAMHQCLLGFNKIETIKSLLSMGVSSMTENIFGFSPLAFSSICPNYVGEVVTGLERDDNAGCNHYIAVCVEDKNVFVQKITNGHCFKPKVTRFPYAPENLRLDRDILDHVCSGKYLPVFLKKCQKNSAIKAIFNDAFCLFKEQYLKFYSEKQLKRYVDYYLDQRIGYVILGVI